jgi:hypothetical protein
MDGDCDGFQNREVQELVDAVRRVGCPLPDLDRLERGATGVRGVVTAHDVLLRAVGREPGAQAADRHAHADAVARHERAAAFAVIQVNAIHLLLAVALAAAGPGVLRVPRGGDGTAAKGDRAEFGIRPAAPVIGHAVGPIAGAVASLAGQHRGWPAVGDVQSNGGALGGPGGRRAGGQREENSSQWEHRRLHEV